MNRITSVTILGLLALFSSAICRSADDVVVAPVVTDATEQNISKTFYRCWIPAVPGAFEQPEFLFEFQQNQNVAIRLASAWTTEEVSTEKIISKTERKVNRMGRIFPVAGNVIEEKVRTARFSYAMLIPAAEDGVYFKEEQNQTEPEEPPIEGEAAKEIELLAPGSISFKIPNADEPGGFYTETWSLVCRVPQSYRDQILEQLNKEEEKSLTPADIYNILRGLLGSVLKLQPIL